MMRQERQSLPEQAPSFRLRRSPLNSATYRTLVRVLSHRLEPVAASGDASRSSLVCPFGGPGGEAGAPGSSRSDGREGGGVLGDGVHEASGTGDLASPFHSIVPDSTGTTGPQRLTNLMTAGLKLHSRDQRGGRGDGSVASPHASVGSDTPSGPEQKPYDERDGGRPEGKPDDGRGGSCDVLVDSIPERESSNMSKVASIGDTAVHVSVGDPASDQFLMDLESGFAMEVDGAGLLDLQKELHVCIHGDAGRDSPAKAPQLMGSRDGSTVGNGDKEFFEGKNVVGGWDASDKLPWEQVSGLDDALPAQDVKSILIEGSNHEMNGHGHYAASSASCQDAQIIVANGSVDCPPHNEQSTKTPIQPHKEQSTETPIKTPEAGVPLLSLQHAKLSVSQDDNKMGSPEKIEVEDNLAWKEGTGSTASQNNVAVQNPVANISCNGGSCIVQSIGQGEEATFSHTGSDNQMPSTNESDHGVDTVAVAVKENTASECSSSTSRKFVEDDVKANDWNHVTDRFMEEGEIEDGEIPNDLEDIDQIFDIEAGKTSVMEKSSAEKTLSMDTTGEEPGGSISTSNMDATNSSIKNHVAGLLDYTDLDWLKDEAETVKPIITPTYKKRSDKSKVKARDETSPNNLNQNDEPVKETIPTKEKSCKSKNGEVRIMTKERKGKKKNGEVRIMTKERKEKKKIAKKRKRAEENKKLGVKRLKIQPVVMPKKVVDCKYHLLGRCREGEACKFSHDKTPLTKSKPCEHFIHDRCLKGDDCPYDHELSKYPCHNFTSKGSCIRGAKCKFSHEISAVEDVPARDAGSKHGPSTIQGEASLGNHVKRTCIPNLITKAESPLKTSTSQVSVDKQSLGEAQIGTRTPQKPPKGIRFLSFEKKLMENNRKTQKSLDSVGGLDSKTRNWPKHINGLLGSDQIADGLSTSSNSQKLLSSVKPACDILTPGNKKPPHPSTLVNMSWDLRIHKSSGSTQCSTLSSVSTRSAVTEASRLLQEFLFLGGS